MLIRNELALAEVAHTSCHSKIPTLTILSTSISKPTKIQMEIVEAKLAKGVQVLHRLSILFRIAR